MGYTLGIDLGTTYSAAAVARSGKADRFPLGTRSAVIPSIVCLRADGEVLVGEAAERRGLLEPTRTAREFKRRLGDPTPLLLGGTPYGAEALMAHLLRWIVDRVEEQQGAAADAVVLSHPANWGPYKLDLLQQTVRLAEVETVSFLTEPEAAAVHYAGQERLDPDEVVAVYDFGGGTFDAAVLRRTIAGFELLGAPEGMERIGGIDFDQAVFAHVDAALGGAVAELDPDDTSAMAAVSRLRDECQLAKEQLSHDTDVDIPVLLPGVQTEVRLTRSEFEGMIRPRVGETVRALDRAVRSAGLGMDDVAKVLLVGGTSRIPLVGQLVREETGRPIAVDAHPKFAIAIGAAVVGEEGDTRSAPATPVAPAGADETAPAGADETAPVDPAPTTPIADVAPDASPDAPVTPDEPATSDEPVDTSPDAPEVTPDGTPDASPDEPAVHAPTEEVPRVAAAVTAGSGLGGAAVADSGSPGTGRASSETSSAAATDGNPTKARRRSLLLVVGGIVALLLVLAVVRPGPDDGDPGETPVADVTPSPDADDDEGDDGGVTDEPSDDPTEAVVDPDTTVDGITVADDGTVQVAFTTAGFDVSDSGYGVQVGWVDEFSQPLDVAPATGASGPSPFAGLDTLSRPVAATGVCVQTVTPDGEQPVEDPGHCATADESLRTGMPGERFVRVDEVEVNDGTYVVGYTPFGYTPELGGEGTWHVHFFFWPSSDEDIVGVNIPGEERGSWAAWDAPVFDGFSVDGAPADATHICGVVAEFDHTIRLQEDGTGYPSGTCVALS